VSGLITSWLLALALGVRHATEPDHVVAVTTLVADLRDAKGAAKMGAIWGVGHTLALLGVGGGLMFLRFQMPERLANLFELGVAFMLLALGTRSIVLALRLRAAANRVGAGSTPNGHANRPLLIGLVHGLAGSGALAALTVSTTPSIGSGFVYMALFGLGSVAGMAALSGLLGFPLARFTQTLRVRVAALATAGVLSLVIGVAWGWPLVWRVSAG
jgi:hypothetical protein